MPLTLSELHNALMKISNIKAPDPDGFPREFIKHFCNTMAPLFYRSVTEIKTKGKIPSHMNTTLIRLLLKPYKDPTLPSSHHPLSLINTDIKIISKALVFRLE